MNVLSFYGLRTDGRKPDELRKIRCKVGLYNHANGSAYLEMGNTKVAATIYGPHEIVTKKGQLAPEKALINCQYSIATFSTTHTNHYKNSHIQENEIIKKSFESVILTHLFPKSQIDIFIEVLQSDGSSISAAINVASLALINAGIPMKDSIASCTIGIFTCQDSYMDDMESDTTKCLIDLNGNEDLSRIPKICIALKPKSKEIINLDISNRLHMDILEPAMNAAINGCCQIYEVLDIVLKNYYAVNYPSSLT